MFTGGKPRALVFVDYEHWHVSMYKKFSQKPQIRKWRDELLHDYNIVDMFFFADFSNSGMKYEIPRIREVTNNVIETQNTSPHYKKDFTDFIMLDYIYQRAVSSKGIDTFIIFTGDGHFTSVVKFLTNSCKKNVVVYAIRDSLSGMLRNAASSCFEIPTDRELDEIFYSVIINDYDEICESKSRGGKRFFPTFSVVLDAVSEKHGTDAELVRVNLEKMINAGYFTQEVRYLSAGKRIKVLCINRERLKADGIRIIPDTDKLVIQDKNRQKSE